MAKPQNLGHLAHIVAYDAENHITVPAGITMHTNQLVASQAWVTTALGSYALSSSLSSYVPTSRTITINGTSFDLSANRNWDITSMIYPAAGIALSTGSAWGTSITNNSGNWNTAYGWGNHASAGYATTSALSSYLLLAGGTLTGALSGTSALFTGNLRTDTGLGLKYGSFVSTSGYLNLFSALVGSTMTLNLKDGTGGFEIALTFPASANRSYTFPSANGTIALTSDIPSLSGYVPTSRTITINGTTLDLSANRSFTVTASETDTLATVTARGATTTAAITTGVLTVNTGGTGTWGPFVVTSTSQWGDGATQYVTIGAGGAAGIMINNPHIVWNTSEVAAGVKFGRSGGISSGSYYVIGTGASNNFFINKDGAIATPVFNINSSGNATFSGTVTAPTFSGALSGNASTASAAAGSSFLTQTNATWGARMQLGGNGDPGAAANIAVVQATDGNLHMDCGTGKSMYLNYYRNGIIYLNGGTYNISANGSQYNGNAATATNATNADNIDGWSFVNTGSNGATSPDTIASNGISYTSVALLGQSDGALYSQAYSSSWQHQIFGDYRTGQMAIRGKQANSWQAWRTVIDSGNIGSQKVDGSLKFWATTHPSDYYLVNNWTGSHWYITSNHPSPVRVGYADTAGSAPANGGTSSNTNSISNATGGSYDWTGIQYFVTNNGGQAVNNSNSAKLQANSSGGNSAFMSFHRGGYYAVNFGLDDDNYMRMGGWSAPANRWQLNMVSGDCTLSGFQRAVDFYTTGWFRVNGTGGMYQQDYGGHFHRSVDGSFGTWQMSGGARNGYSGLNIIDPQGYWNNLMYENGTGGVYSENGTGWSFYMFRGNDCIGLNGSETYDWVRACTNGKHRITNDSWCDATSWAYTFSNISDGRLKENIVTVDSALEKVLQLRGVYYNWIIDTENKKHIGLIAQETAAVCPEVVNYHDETDTYSVNYSELSGLFVESTKELNQKLMDANARIELLETKLNQLLNA